jgi:hypothetical protein
MSTDGATEAGVRAPASVHPDLLERCRRCRFLALEHDPVDMRCPDDEDEARLNAEECE